MINIPPKLTDCIEWVAQTLADADVYFGHGTDNAYDEAVWLVMYGLNIFDQLPIKTQESEHVSVDEDNYQLSVAQRQQLANFLTQRIEQRKPTAYILHKAWFAQLAFIVDERVLIPRSPIAELILNHYRPWLPRQNSYRMLDLCCGSGCIGLASAKHMDNTFVDLLDISADALQLAARNQSYTDLENNSQIIQSDLFDALTAQQQYDLIVSNPPYVDQQDLAQMPAEYHHEPRLGLAAGVDGLSLVRRILDQAGQYLTASGILIVEVGNSERHLLREYPTVPFIWLEFSQGGTGVFLLTAEQLHQHKAEFAAAIENDLR